MPETLAERIAAKYDPMREMVLEAIRDFAREAAGQIRAEKVPAIASPSIVNVPAAAYWDGFSRGLVAATKILERAAGGEG